MGEEGTPKTEMINPALLDGVSANFIVKGPNGVEKAYPMRAISVTIGRSDQCDIAVKDGSMSGRHAEISKINGEIRRWGGPMGEALSPVYLKTASGLVPQL